MSPQFVAGYRQGTAESSGMLSDLKKSIQTELDSKIEKERGSVSSKRENSVESDTQKKV